MKKLYTGIFVCTILTLFATQAGAVLHPEKDYQTAWCNKNGGVMGLILPDGTMPDCMVGDYAVEVDFAKKIYECAGQAMHYSKMTGKVPGCLLVVEDPAEIRTIRPRGATRMAGSWG